MRRVMLTMVIAAAACGSPAADSDESTTSTTTTTTILAPTTTSIAPEGPIAMSTATNTFFEPGVSYRADFLPLEAHFRFEQPGWRTVVIVQSGGFIEFTNTQTGISEPLSLGLKFASDPQAETLDRIRFDENALDATPLTTTALGGLSAATFDVTIPATYDVGPSPCTGAVTLVNFGTVETGPFAHGLLGCARNRVWVAENNEQSVIVYAGLSTEDDSNIAQLNVIEPLLDDFINAITFCTEAAPCDG